MLRRDRERKSALRPDLEAQRNRLAHILQRILSRYPLADASRNGRTLSHPHSVFIDRQRRQEFHRATIQGTAQKLQRSLWLKSLPILRALPYLAAREHSRIFMEEPLNELVTTMLPVKIYAVIGLFLLWGAIGWIALHRRQVRRELVTDRAIPAPAPRALLYVVLTAVALALSALLLFLAFT